MASAEKKHSISGLQHLYVPAMSRRSAGKKHSTSGLGLLYVPSMSRRSSSLELLVSEGDLQPFLLSYLLRFPHFACHRLQEPWASRRQAFRVVAAYPQALAEHLWMEHKRKKDPMDESLVGMSRYPARVCSMNKSARPEGNISRSVRRRNCSFQAED